MTSSLGAHARCGCAGAAGSFSLQGTERNYERARPFAVRHLALDLALDFDARTVAGSATLTIERREPGATQLTLDAIGFEVSQVSWLEGRRKVAADFEYDGERLVVSVPRRTASARLRVAYSAKPRRGLYFLAPDATVKDRPVQAWTQCQDEDARHWFPCHDAPHMKMTTEVAVTVPNGFTVLSNGDPVSDSRPRGEAPWRWHFKMAEPHSSYLVTLVAGRFDVVSDRPARRPGGADVPVTYYVPVGRAGDAPRSLGETPRMIELFARLTGTAFPWSRYSQVVVSDFIFGGMENTTATTLYEHVLLDARAAIDVSSMDLVAHELAHQWFGDLVTCRDWSHGWLNEGFATYFEHVEREDRLGRDEYDHGVAGDLASYLGEAGGRYTRPVVCREYDEPIDLFDRHLYEKGSLVLHLLRRRLGDATFWRGIGAYLERHAGGVVETRDLQRALEEVSGQALDRFFDEWLYRPGHPALKVRVSWEEGAVRVHVKQTQKVGDTALFHLPIEIEVEDAAGKRKRHEKLLSAESDTLVVPLSKRPAWVAFDPDFRVVGDVTFEAPGDLLRHQLERGSSARVKVQAAEALAKKRDLPTIRALGRSLGKTSEPWMVRAECASALGSIRGEDALGLLVGAARTDHAKVRRAVASALGRFKKPEAAAALTALAKKDPSYLVEAEACRALGATRDPSARRTLLSLVDREAWADVRRAGALDGLAALGDEGALDAVTRATRYGVPTRGRRAAISALARLGEGRAVRDQLEQLLDDDDPHLRIDVIRALEQLGDSRARGPLRRRLAREDDGRVTRRLREALRDLDAGATPERKRVNEELEALRSKLGELETRLEKLVQHKRKGKKS